MLHLHEKVTEKLFKMLSPSPPPREDGQAEQFAHTRKTGPKKWALRIVSAEKFLWEEKVLMVREMKLWGRYQSPRRAWIEMEAGWCWPAADSPTPPHSPTPPPSTDLWLPGYPFLGSKLVHSPCCFLLSSFWMTSPNSAPPLHLWSCHHLSWPPRG